MNGKQCDMKGYLEERVAQCAQVRRELMADNRGDEANFQAIQGNVYGIFSTILTVAVEQNHGNDQGVEDFFLKKLEEIPAQWEQAREKALVRGDDVAAHLEWLKLEAAEDVGCTFRAIWGAKA